MRIKIEQTKTYILSELENVSPTTAYVTNFEPGRAKLVIECGGDVWAIYWGGMSADRIQEFFVGSSNEFIIKGIWRKEAGDTEVLGWIIDAIKEAFKNEMTGGGE